MEDMNPIFKFVKNFHFMVMEDIGPILKIFKEILDGSSGLFGPRLFQKSQTFDLQHFEIAKKNSFESDSALSMSYLGIFGVSKDN